MQQKTNYILRLAVLILIIFSAVLHTANPVHAQSVPNATADTSTTGQAVTPAGNQNTTQGAGSAVAGAVGGVALDIVGGAISAVAQLVLTVSNFLLGLAGVFLNTVIVKTVFQFSQILGNSPGVLLAWGILRDIANIVLLFGFIYIGIATILDLGTYSAKKALPSLLAFAVLLNFSLFAAEAIIDTSNVLTSAIYSQANNDPCSQGNTTGSIDTDACGINYGLAGHIMDATGLSTTYSSDREPTPSAYVGLALFSVIGTIVLVAAAILLIVRAVTLTFVMVAAPIGFAGLAIPMFNKFGKRWWDTLLSQAIFAPAMILLMLISLKISDGFVAGTGGHSLAAAMTDPNVSSLSIVLVFALVIGFLVLSIVSAKKLGASGSSFALKAAGSATFGTVGFLGRRTVGAGSIFAANKIAGSNWARKNPKVGRLAYGIANKGATSSFDFRATGAAGTIGKSVGDLGKVRKSVSGGFKGQVADAAKAKESFAKNLKNSKGEAADIKAANAAIKTATAALERAKAANDDPEAKKQEAIIANYKKILKATSDKPQKDYAEAMKDKGLVRPFLARDSNNIAAANILKGLDKNDLEKLIAAIPTAPTP